MINIIANQELKKKFTWFLVLMLWVGMVTAVVVHKSSGEQDHIAQMSSTEGQVQIETTKLKEGNSSNDRGRRTDHAQGFNLAKKAAKDEGEDFFVEYRIERDQARSEQINLLREMINNPNSDKELKNQAQTKLLAITNNLEEEMEIESLIQARGYKDGIAFIHDDSVEVIVAAEGLNRKDVAKIGDLITNTTSISLKDITIIEKPPE